MSAAPAASARLDALPTAGLGTWPSPLHRLDRFGAALDLPAGTEVWIKRDDVQGVALAGNKVRKYDLVLGQALADGYDTLVTTGAAQSNSARAGAAAAAAVGMGCVLLLSGDEPGLATGNLLLDQLLGADIRFAGKVGWQELNEGVRDLVLDLAAAGRTALAAPVGCSTPLGALGFAKAFIELDQQLSAAGLDPTAIVHTTTSGGTHAGLLVGRAITGRPVRLIGVDAAAMFAEPTAALAELAAEAAQLIEVDLHIDPADVELVTSQLGERYGAHTEAGNRAIRLLAQTEAIVTDPIYSAKGLAGLVELLRSEALSGPVVFWHTGGYHALFDPSHGGPAAAGARRPAC